MKIRNGFVSNSSSTSFTMCFKDSEEELYEMLKKYAVYFDLIYPYEQDWKVNIDDVINSIKECLVKNDDYEKIEITSVDDAIVKQEECVEQEKEYVKKHPDRYNVENIFEENDKLEKLQTAKKRGLQSVIIIGFGDNSGNVCGGRIGNTMDYEGRHININKEDFIVFTEQNR